jgi:hypothetical protein
MAAVLTEIEAAVSEPEADWEAASATSVAPAPALRLEPVLPPVAAVVTEGEPAVSEPELD